MSLVFGFPGGSVVKNLPGSAADMGSIPGLGRKKWQPIPVFLPEKTHGQRSPKCCRELDTTEHSTESQTLLGD